LSERASISVTTTRWVDGIANVPRIQLDVTRGPGAQIDAAQFLIR
jgi:hypothetical protein